MRTKNLTLAVVVALGMGLWFGREAQAQFTITRKSSPIFYIDSGISPQLKGMYVAYEICNTGGTNYPDIWANISNFTGGVVSLAPYEDGVVHLGPLNAGQCKTAFFYLQASGPTTTSQSHTVSVFAAPPPGTALASATFSFTAVEETIKASANKVNTVVATPNPPVLGGLVIITVTGETGTIGAAKILSFTPASYLNWPANAFELISTSITFSGGNTGTFTNQLYIIATNTANTNYTAVYTFRITDFTTSVTAVSPTAYISSGTQIKHTDTGNFGSFDPVQPPSNTLVVLTKTANPPSLSGAGTVTYTVTIHNTSASQDATLDSFVDTLSTSPATPTYVTGSSTFDGAPIPDPVISGNILTWNLHFTVPAGTTRALTYQLSFPNICGVYTNSFVGYVGPIQIDTTLDTTDNAPATQAVSVCALDLAIDKSHTGDFIVGQNGIYTITVTNIGSGDTTGTITVTDTLPAGLGFISGTGAGWSCSAAGQIVTCTRTDPLGPGESTNITLTVSVSGAAFPSVTNSVTVNTPGDGDPTTNSDDDQTDVVAPDLQIVKSHTEDFTTGSTGVYTITVTNVGGGPTHGPIVVTDTLPTGLSFISGTGTNWTCSAAGQTVICTNPGPLTPGASTTITLTVSVLPDAAPGVINTVTVLTPDDPDPDNNSDDDPTEVTLGAGQICGFKWLDLDADGNRAEHEPYLSGITITLTGTDIFGNPVSMTTVTDENGQYCFTGLLAGTYLICEAPPMEVPFFETFPVSGPVCSNGTIGWLITLGDGQTVNRVKFGNVPDEPTLVPLAVTTIQAVATPQAVYFRALGQGIKEIAVELFDLSGRTIYRSGWQKNNLMWAYQNERAERVAAGVYLYFMAVKGYDGTVVKPELRKLVVSPKPTTTEERITQRSLSATALSVPQGIEFRLSGKQPRALQIQIFDLSGRVVYTSDWTGSSLVWGLHNSAGQRVAKGVYLYAIIVRDSNDTIVRTKLQKLIVK